jgi:hypothetical protein
MSRLGPAIAAIGFVSLGDPRAIVTLVPLVALHLLVEKRSVARASELGIYAALAAVVVATLRFGPEPRGGFATTIAGISAVFVGARSLFVPSFARHAADLGLVLVAATATGAPPQRFLPYGPLAIALLVLATYFREPRGETTKPTPAHVAARRRALGMAALFLAISSLAGFAMGRALPIFTYRYATRLAKLVWERPRSSFEEDMVLEDGDASARTILESERVVLKVSGTSVDHLRGKVYDLFDGRRWHGMTSVDAPRGVAPSRGTRVTVEAVHPSHVYFAPLDYAVVNATTRDGSIAKGPLRSTWEMVPEKAALAPPVARDLPTDRASPERVRALALEWTAGAPTDNDKLLALEEHLLRDYKYSLTREPFDGSALMDFLFVHKSGHCELFATAFALLARSIGIPARVVGGYRVVEPGPEGNTYVVRERHAHAWVEAFHGGTWHVWDPTPASAFSRKAPLWERALDAISDPRTLVVIVLITALGATFVFVRAFLQRRAEARSRGAMPEASPQLARLEASLAEAGFVRPRHEGLFVFAESLDGHGEVAAARAVRSAAHYLYGHEGTAESLAEAVDRAIAERTKPRPA